MTVFACLTSYLGQKQRKKKISKVCKDCGLSITITTNITSMLHLTLNLKTESYQPLRKANNTKSNNDSYIYI